MGLRPVEQVWNLPEFKNEGPLLKEIGDHFIDSTVELVKKAHRLVFVLDNMDWTVKVHEIGSKQRPVLIS